MSSFDNYKQVLISDGEAITFGDLNDQVRFIEARLMEQVLHNQISSISIASNNRDPQFGGQDGADHPSSRCYCLNAGGAYLRQGSANHKIQLAPGTLLQKIGVLTGNDPLIVPFTFKGTEEWTLTNGDGAHPRIDLLQMQLQWVTDDVQARDFEDAVTDAPSSQNPATKRRVQCTLSVKAGVAAVSPVIPEPDVGFVPVGSVMVGETWVIAGNTPIFGADTASAGNVVVHDQRIPLGVRAYTVDPSQFKTIAGWGLIDNNSSIQTTTAVNDVMVPCPHVSNGRLIGISVSFNDDGSGNALNGQELGQATGSTASTYAKSHTVANLPVSTVGMDDYIEMFASFEALHSPSAGPTIQQSVTTKIGVPIWTNGRRCPHEKFRIGGGIGKPEHLVYRIHNAAAPGVGVGPIVGRVTFFVAEGL